MEVLTKYSQRDLRVIRVIRVIHRKRGDSKITTRNNNKKEEYKKTI